MYLKVFGKTKAIANDLSHTYSADYKYCSPFVLDHEALNIDGLFLLSRSEYPTIKFKGVIYSDNAGQPDALLHVTNEITGIFYAWNYIPFSSRISSLPAGTYHLGFINDYSIPTLTDFIANSLEYNADTYADGPSDPFGTPTLTYYQVPIGAVEDLPSVDVFKLNYYTVLKNIGLTTFKLNYYAVLRTKKFKSSTMMVIT